MTRGHSSSLSSSVATRARMGLRVAPIVNSTSGLATAFKNHSGSRSSPPFDATSTNRSPSTTGVVRIVDRTRPDFRPTTCNSTTVIPNAEPPIRPPLMRRTERCTEFRVRKPPSTMNCFHFTSRTYRVPRLAKEIVTALNEWRVDDRLDSHALRHQLTSSLEI